MKAPHLTAGLKLRSQGAGPNGTSGISQQDGGLGRKCRMGQATEMIAIVAVAVAATLCVLMCIGLLGGVHAHILESALAPKSKTPGKPSDGAGQLYTGVNTLSNDLLAIMVPTVSVASAGGGIAWALGSHRGQGIVIGALLSGVTVVLLKTFVA